MAIDDPAVSGRVRVVVVGLDGGAESAAALEWAVRVLERCTGTDESCRIHAVAATKHHAATDERRAELDRWVASAQDRGVEVTGQVVVEGDPAAALLTVADDVGADLVAVGMHSRRHLTRRSIGKVTAHLLETSERPVAVVPPAPDAPHAEGTTVVAGVGHDHATMAALTWAAGFAADCGTELSLVHAVTHRPMFNADGLLDVLACYVDPSLQNEWALEDLSEVAAELQRSTEEEVPLSWSAPSARPGPALVEAGSDAALVIIGRHGDPGAHPRVTPTMRHVLTHAPCPVVIVPAAATDAEPAQPPA